MALWPQSQAANRTKLPPEVQARIALVNDAVNDASVDIGVVLHHGDTESLRALCRALAQRPGPIVSVEALPPGNQNVLLDRLLIERALSVNTAAAGGNASLMTIG